MERRRSLPLMTGYALAAAVIAGVATRLAARDSDAVRWLIGAGSSLFLLIDGWQTAQAVLMIWRSWQLRLFAFASLRSFVRTQATLCGAHADNPLSAISAISSALTATGRRRKVRVA